MINGWRWERWWMIVEVVPLVFGFGQEEELRAARARRM